MSKKVKLVNSPFEFEQVGFNAADRWFRQDKGYFNKDQTVFTFHPDFSVRLQMRSADEQFEAAVAENCNTRVWRSRHSGKSPYPGGPENRVRQFVPISPREAITVDIADKVAEMVKELVTV